MRQNLIKHNHMLGVTLLELLLVSLGFACLMVVAIQYLIAFNGFTQTSNEQNTSNQRANSLAERLSAQLDGIGQYDLNSPLLASVSGFALNKERDAVTTNPIIVTNTFTPVANPLACVVNSRANRAANTIGSCNQGVTDRLVVSTQADRDCRGFTTQARQAFGYGRLNGQSPLVWLVNDYYVVNGTLFCVAYDGGQLWRGNVNNTDGQVQAAWTIARDVTRFDVNYILRFNGLNGVTYSIFNSNNLNANNNACVVGIIIHIQITPPGNPPATSRIIKSWPHLRNC